MVVSEDCHGTALQKSLEIAHGSELRTLNIFTSAFASNTTTDYVNRLTATRPPTDAQDMTSKRAEVLLGSGNYFHWEYNMRMTLARKGLLAHVGVVKPENEVTEAWLVSDAKSLGIIAQGVEIQHQTKIRSATRAMHAWGVLRDFYNRSTLHNRVTMTRRLYAFKMENGTGMAQHLDAFDELVVGLQTLGEVVDEARQLVVLPSSLPSEYDMISSIIENAKDVSLIEVKEKLLRSMSVWRRRTPRWRRRSKLMGTLISSRRSS